MATADTYTEVPTRILPLGIGTGLTAGIDAQHHFLALLSISLTRTMEASIGDFHK